MANSRCISKKSIRFVVVLLSASALLVSYIVPFTRARNGQLHEQGRNPRSDGAKPQPGKPEGSFPNLNELKRRESIAPAAAAEIHSNIRSRKKPLEPRNGRRVGDEAEKPAQPDSLLSKLRPSSERSRAAQRRVPSHHPRVAAPLPLQADQYLQNFFNWSVAQAPSPAEVTYWMEMQRSAYANGQWSMVLAVREMGKTLFESSRYASRGRDNHWYVHDLYQAYLMRGPDPGGWAFWESLVPSLGREAIRRAFDESGEFINLVNTITANGSVSSAVSSLVTARTDPFSQPGNGLKSRDAEWSVSLLSLPGRAGLDLGLGLSYSSLVWSSSGPYLYFDEDNGSPSPGFRLGFPTIQERFFNAQVGDNSYLLLTSSGRRVELRQVGASNIYEAVDSSYLQLIDNGSSLLVRSTDGTRMTYGKFEDEWRCQQIKDRNGNYITVNYNTLGNLTTVTDTLGRVITLNYDGNANLISITQPWNASTHTWATFGWATQVQSTFTGNNVVGAPSGTILPVLTQVSLHDGNRYTFEYNNALQVSLVRFYSLTMQRNYTIFSYDNYANDCPRLIMSHVWAENWTGLNGVPIEVVTQYSALADGSRQLTAPDGTVYKEFYGTGWQRGLVTTSEVWAGGVRQKWTATAWTQDNTNLSYQLNPRVRETNVYDSAGNRKRTEIQYHGSFGLPLCITEYAADGANVIRFTVHHYKFDAQYLDRRIIGLPDSDWVFTNSWQVQSKTSYGYDWGAHLEALPNGATAIQHDGANYGASFSYGRGNLSVVTRWDANDDGNFSKAIEHKYGHNITGSLTFTRDPLWHYNFVNYTDSFSDNINRNTFAYPTTMTDADGKSSTRQYNFDFAAQTRTQAPAPAGQSQGLTQIYTYDPAGRLDRLTTTNSGAYVRYVYGPYYVQSYSTVNNQADDAYAIEIFDGLGRVVGTASNHPGSAGGYKAQNTIYDQMGRMMKQSNPTEVFWTWAPYGDDAAGWLYTQWTYDWKGRPLVTTISNGATKQATYSGCGCTGSEVVTLTDEGTVVNGVTRKRQQKIYLDVLGRTWKTEALNWDGPLEFGTGGSVYSTTVNAYNVRDQVTSTRQYQGPATSGVYQETLMTYDGYGRIKTKHVPDQSVGATTTWDYNSDDTIQKITDARGASQSFSYNARHLLTSVTHQVPPGSSIPNAPNASFAYDNAGNRTLMIDGLGSVTYQYNQLSRLTSETRYFSTLTGSVTGGNYTTSYQYNLAGGLTNLTDPFGYSVNYSIDQSGRLSGITAPGFQGHNDTASGIAYRAWGAMKQATFTWNGMSHTVSYAYNARLEVSRFQVTGVTGTLGDEYQRNPDGHVRYAQDLNDPEFDRAYSYDELGRVTQALSGSEARNQSGANGPYKQTYSYDTWRNMKTRVGRHWTQSVPSLNATFTNNRNTQWQYDAEGNLLNDTKRQYTYDASGNMTYSQKVGGGPPIVTQVFDGDGLPVKRPSFATTYEVRSRLLGGQIISELNSQGAKNKGYLYAEGRRVGSNIQANAENYVFWEHRNPINSGILGGSYGQVVSRDTELDPLGDSVATENPYLWGGGGDGSYPQYGSAASFSGGGCSFEGGPIDCNMVMKWFYRNPIEALHTTTHARVGMRTAREIYTAIYGDDVLISKTYGPAVSGPNGAQVTVTYEPPQLKLVPDGYFTQWLFLGGITTTGMKYLPPGGSYGPDGEKKIKDALEKILYNGKCADAFQKAGLDTPAGLLSKGIVIGPATLLLDPNNNSGNGITEAARARDVGVVGSTAIQAITISDHPGYKPDTTDGRARIFLNSSAFGGGAYSLQQVLAHELIHVAGIGPKDPGFFGSLVGSDDLSHFKGYNEIFAACGGP